MLCFTDATDAFVSCPVGMNLLLLKEAYDEDRLMLLGKFLRSDEIRNFAD